MKWDASLFVVMAPFWVCSLVIRTFFVRPMMRLLEERRGTIESARSAHQRARAESDARLEQERVLLQKNRLRARQRREEVVKAAQNERARRLQETKAQAERELGAAVAGIEAAATEQRTRLQANAEALALAVVARLVPGAARR